MPGRYLPLALLLLFPVSVGADEPKTKPKAPAAPVLVPYRLTDTHHTMVRVKINGKGPFNFIVDTGCPVFLISEQAGKKAGLKPVKGWSTLDKLELEGGLVLDKVRARVETPFQITGMNGMGLAGVELHGMMGYTVLAKFKMEFDFTKKQMLWTPLTFNPPPPKSPGGKAASGGIDGLSIVVQLMTWIAGIGPLPPPQPRGFFGFELNEKDGQVVVTEVLPKSPAAQAGLQKGDLVLAANERPIRTTADLLKQAATLTAGKSLGLTIQRGPAKQELKITAGEGL